MINSINIGEHLNQEMLTRAFSEVKNWLGRGIRWIQSKTPSIHSEVVQCHLALYKVFAADFLIFLLAFRIANLWKPDRNHLYGSKSNHSFIVGPETLLLYGLGTLALSKVMKVPFSTPIYACLHMIAFIGSSIFLYKLITKD